ncbi:hypothetical protein ACFQS4_08525 [Saliphagus sp. GCM10025317]
MRPTPTAGRLAAVAVIVFALGAGLLVGLCAADTSELVHSTSDTSCSGVGTWRT